MAATAAGLEYFAAQNGEEQRRIHHAEIFESAINNRQSSISLRETCIVSENLTHFAWDSG